MYLTGGRPEGTEDASAKPLPGDAQARSGNEPDGERSRADISANQPRVQPDAMRGDRQKATARLQPTRPRRRAFPAMHAGKSPFA